LSALITPSPRLTEAETLKLFSALEHLVQRHQKLLACLQNEKRLIIEGKVEGLLSCVAEKEKLLRAIADLEEERIRIMAELEGANRVKTLKTLLSRLSPLDREKLETLGSQLDALTAGITEINEINGVLVKRVLGQISDLFTLLGQLNTDGDTYQGSGKMNIAAFGRTISRG